MNGRLTGQRLLVTRDPQAAGAWIESLEAQGARVEARAILAFEPARDRQAARDAIAHLDRYPWVVFASANGARFFAEWCRAEAVPRPGGLRVAAIGEATAAAARDVGWEVDFVCSRGDGAGFGAALAPVVGAGNRVLVVRPEVGRPELAAALGARGVRVDEAVVYRTVAARDVVAVAADVRRGRYDAIVFTSPSTLEFLLACATRVEGLREALERVLRIAIGPTTGAALSREGLAPAAVARRPDTESLVAAVVAATAA